MKIKATMCLLVAGVTITTMGACVKSPYASAAEEAARALPEESEVEQTSVPVEITEDSTVETPEFSVELPEEDLAVMDSMPVAEDSEKTGEYPHTWESCEEKARGFNDSHLNYWLDHGSVYDPDEITEEMLQSRTDQHVIIEHVHGICMDEAGNGRALNTNSEYDYIAYNGFACTALVACGDIVDTYLIYDPACQAPDCIIERRDFITYHDEDAVIETAELEELYGETEES